MKLLRLCRRLNHGLCAVALLGAFLTCARSAHAAQISGSAEELPPGNLTDPRGFVYDAILLTGPSATLQADAGQRAIIYFLDSNDDIVTVAFAGAGTLAIALDDSSGPAAPVNYNQFVAYMKGLARLSIAGADSTTSLWVSSVGRANSFDPTGHYDFTLPISESNNPANNGNPLFSGHADTVYDGVADIASLTITGDGASEFGTLDLANVRFSASSDFTGISAPGVAVTGPVTIEDISASGSAAPKLIFGSVDALFVAGGSLHQANGASIQVAGMAQPGFTAGLDAHGHSLPAHDLDAELYDDSSPQHPEFTGDSAATFTAEIEGSFKIETSEAPGATFSIVGGDFPSWASLDPNTGVVTGKPDAPDDTPLTYDVQVTYDGGYITKPFSLTVVAPPPPAIRSADAAVAIAGQPFRFQVEAAGVVDQFSATGLPDGLAIDAHTGLIAGIIASGTSYTVSLQAENLGGTDTSTLTITVDTLPAFTLQPQGTIAGSGDTVVLTAAGTGTPAPTYQWLKNDSVLTGETAPTLTLANFSADDAAAYSVLLTNAAGSTLSSTAVVGLASTAKVAGSGREIGHHVLHPNGNHYDQVLLTGTSETITADPGVVTRTSFIDLNDDIVQVEFTGAGTLTLTLADASGPAEPVKYTQPTVAYMRGHASIVISGADETTNLSVFTVGRATAFDPTGGFDFLLPISATNLPANNGSSLFSGHAETDYDGVADIAFVAISSRNGKFGGVRTADARYWAHSGFTGLYAPGVAFQGPVYIGNIDAFDTAIPMLLVGSVADARITGGDLKQDDGLPIQVSGLTTLEFLPGTDSGGYPLPVQTNLGTLIDNGTDVTSQTIIYPAPPDPE